MLTIKTPVSANVDEDDDIQSVQLKHVSVEDLEDDDILLSVNSLMNFVEVNNFNAEQLKQLMVELVAATEGGMLNGRSNATVEEFLLRYANAAHEFAPEAARDKGFPRFESTLTAEQRAADVRFFKTVTLRGTEPEHRSGEPGSTHLATYQENINTDPDWQKNAEARWLAAAKERLDEVTRELNRSCERPGEERQMKQAAYRGDKTYHLG
jgi:hypothetical protein